MKKYGLVWEDKPETVAELCKEKLPILTEVKSKEVLDSDDSPNILIEGDNYHALSVLNYTHKGKIDLIYIDPPYNTGNEFIYNDNKVEKDDAYKHSKWLSYMNKRLILAKKLLTDDGVIFISIDDNEQSHLKILCDNIFGERKFLGQIIVVANKGGRDYLEIANMHEYILCYGRSDEVELNKLPKVNSTLKFDDFNGSYDIRELRNRNPKFDKTNRPNLHYPIFTNPDIHDENNHCAVSLEQKKGYRIEVRPRNKVGKDGAWRWGQKKVLDNLVDDDVGKSNVVAKQRRDGGWNIYEKDRSLLSKAKSIWDEKEMRTERGTIVLRQIFKDSVFDHPKPVELIKKCLKLSTNKDSIILDFFAGSGTTGHAVLELNKEDDGNRKFILCTNNENDICTDICYPRLNKVISGYSFKGTEKSELYKQKLSVRTLKKMHIIFNEIEDIKLENNQYDGFDLKSEDGILHLHGIKNITGTKKGLGGNLKYFKTSFVNNGTTDKNKQKIAKLSTEIMCLKEGCFVKHKEFKYFTVFSNRFNKYLAIIYDFDGIAPFIKFMKKFQKKTIVYQFTLDDDPIMDDFEEIKKFMTLETIPAPILSTYRRIHK